jgi:hypothetical protein
MLKLNKLKAHQLDQLGKLEIRLQTASPEELGSIEEEINTVMQDLEASNRSICGHNAALSAAGNN